MKSMKQNANVIGVVLLLLAGCGDNKTGVETPRLSPAVDADMRAFFVLKEEQARALQERDRKEFAKKDSTFSFARDGFPSDVWKCFSFGKAGRWPEMCEVFAKEIAPHSYQFTHPGEPDIRYATTAWQPVNEAYFAFQQLAVANPKHLLAFGRLISDSLPSNSIYFAGTDAGRFVVDFVSLSGGKPRAFYLMSQNQLADGMYAEFLRAITEGNIQLPSSEDSTKAFADYLADAQRRMEANQLKPDERVQIINGRVQASGATPVMEIIARLTEMIFEKNPSTEFFIDNLWVFDWTRPLAEPHGFILKLNRNPIAELSEDAVRQDRGFWAKQMTDTVGDWLNEKTSVPEICNWIERVYLDGNTNGFTGDLDFVETAKHAFSPSDIHGASAVFSKSRANIANVYAWRSTNAKTEREKERMIKEADLAFRQAIALGPTQTDTGFGYYNFLLAHNRAEDALTLVRSVGKLRPNDKLIQDLKVQLTEYIQHQTNKNSGTVTP